MKFEKISLRLLLVIFFILSNIDLTFAQPISGKYTNIPIDGSLGFLIVMGMGYAAKKLRQKNK